MSVKYSIDSIKAAMVIYDNKDTEFTTDVEANDFFAQYVGEVYEVDGKSVEFRDLDGVVCMFVEDAATPISSITGRATLDEVISEAYNKFIADYGDMVTMRNLKNADTAKDLKCKLLGYIEECILAVNANRSKGQGKLDIPNTLSPNVCAMLLAHTGDFKTVLSYARDSKWLVMRQREGYNKGVYCKQTADTHIELDDVLHKLNYAANDRDIKTAINTLIRISPMTTIYTDGRYVACNNGVVDKDTLEFTNYDDDDYDSKYGDVVFMSKVHTNWVQNAPAVVLKASDGYEWSIDKHLEDALNGNDAAIKIIWEYYNFTISGTSGGKTLFFTNSTSNMGGGGGKSTTNDAVEGVIGPENVKHIAVEDLSGRFKLADIVGKKCVIGSESDSAAGKAMDSSKYFKILSRNGVIDVEGKGVNAFQYKYEGSMCFEMNGLPRWQDKSAAVLRRVLVVPFERKFDNGTPRDYIKDEWIKRDDVREYILFKALSLGNIKQYSADCVEALKDNLDAVREASSPVYQLMREIEPTLQNDAIPVPMLFDLYKAWMTYTNGYDRTQTLQTFKQDLQTWCDINNNWSYEPGNKRLAKGFKPEYFLAEYGYLNGVNGMAHWVKTVQSGPVDIKVGGYIKDERYKLYRDYIVRTDTGKDNKKSQDDVEELRDKQQYEQFVGQWCLKYMSKIVSGEYSLDVHLPSRNMWCTCGKPLLNEASGYFESLEGGRYNGDFITYNVKTK